MKKLKIFSVILILCLISISSFIYLGDNISIKDMVAVDYSKDANYTVLFDANGGELSGFDSYEKLRTGVYATNDLSLGQGSSVSSSHLDDKYILYWSKDHKCSTVDLEVGASINVSSHTVFYACYEQTSFSNSGLRYANSGAYVSGDTVNTGDSINLTSCYKTSDGTEYCAFNKKNGSSASGVVFRNALSTGTVSASTEGGTVYFHESSEGVSGYGLDCGKLSYYSDGVCSGGGSSGSSVSTPITSALTSDGKKFIGWAADDDGKNVNCSGSLVTGESVVVSGDVHYYACYDNGATCVNSEKVSDGKGAYKVKVCYKATESNGDVSVEPISGDYDSILTCANGYNLDSISTSNVVENTCTKSGNCYKIYDLSCMGSRPKISSTSGMVRDDGYGTITFSVISNSGVRGIYASNNYLKPTESSDWINDSRGSYSLESTPGTVFLWAIDNDNQISYAAMTSVIDKVNSDTTVKDLEVKSDDGETLNTESYSFDNSINDGITSSDYVRLVNNLEDDSKVLANGFNPFDTAYKVTTTSSKIAVYATLTSNDANYVAGYEPRTVDLDYGVNTILIKIQNKKGKVRTYTIIATREDDRDATNYLKSLTVSEGNLKFDQYTNDYVVSVGKNKKSVSINGELSSLNASYVDGFGPRKIELKNDSTTVAIKVKSETGSVRAYTITFIKSGEETNDSDELLLSSLSLSKAYVAFDKDVTDYNTTVDYEIDKIDIYALAKNGGDSVKLYRSENGITEELESKNIPLHVGSNKITIIISNKDGKSRTYTVNVLRKENGLNISSETSLSMLDVHGYDIEFDPEKLDYVIKIKREKTLVIAATPESNRAEVYIRGNDNLTAFSIVKIKVVSEDGQFREYTIDIKKDTVNKTIETIAIISGVVIIICGIIVIRVKKKRKSVSNYYNE